MLFIIGLTFLNCDHAIAQADTGKVFISADPMPSFPGGEDSLFAFIKAHTRYPDTAIKYGLEGMVMISAVINKDGWVENPEVYKSVAQSLDQEALRVVSMMPPWEPGIYNNTPVKIKMFIPVTFKLEHNQEVFTYVEQMPTMKFNWERFLRENLHYPEESREAGISGRVIVKFIIDEHGNVSDVYALHAPDSFLAKEAVRVVSLMPKWEPGRNKGIPVKTYFTNAMVFKLEDASEQKRKSRTGEPLFSEPDDPEAIPLYSENYIYSLMHYPDSALANNIEGDVEVGFILDKNGRIQYPSITKSACAILDSEALRIVRNIPKSKFVKYNDQAVSKKITLTIRFNIKEYYNIQHLINDKFPSPGFDVEKFIKKNIQYPKDDRNKRIHGKVMVKFVINEDGTISDAAIAGSSNQSLDAEALRLISIMPKWEPAIQRGKATKVYHTLHIEF